jgi:LysM domain
MMMAQHYTVEPGNTLSEIGQRFGISWQSIWRASDPPVSDPNLIYAGEVLNIPVGGSGSTYSPSTPTQGSQVASASQSSPSAVYAPSSSLGDIPGVPVSFACIAYRESTDGSNPAAHGDVYGIIPASGYNVAGDSLAQQQQVVRELYDAYGLRPWAADGCPGT